ncbi:MAG: tRNA pseudouridine(38-40) synthase TruA [Chitinophagaceae bacterium]|nr:tRNA pseudouridine(38-40) synthase TruA [Chitinophagaceae bacterium]
MSRYFIEVKYKGNNYAGFQVQQNAVTIQQEVEKALQIFFRRKINLTGSSRTDAGVHALQNFFHFDEEGIGEDCVYNLNAILPGDVSVTRVTKMKKEDAHCRFDALSRQYRYTVYGKKDPFISDRAYFFPFTINAGLMKEAARVVKEYRDFGAFAKRNSQVKTFNCTILESSWQESGERLEYVVRANRFLRGMVRGLVGTMLQVGRGKITIEDFRSIIESKDSARADFAVPGHGLCLEKVEFEGGYFD